MMANYERWGVFALGVVFGCIIVGLIAGKRFQNRDDRLSSLPPWRGTVLFSERPAKITDGELYSQVRVIDDGSKWAPIRLQELAVRVGGQSTQIIERQAMGADRIVIWLQQGRETAYAEMLAQSGWQDLGPHPRLAGARLVKIRDKQMIREDSVVPVLEQLQKRPDLVVKAAPDYIPGFEREVLPSAPKAPSTASSL